MTVIKVEKRKIYWFFIYPLAAIVFAVISVFFILSAKGYNVSFEENSFVLEKTGMLIVNSKPFGAKIILNSKDTSKKTNFFSVKINSLIKNQYKLVLEKEGFYSWEKDIQIVPEMVTWANYILLFSKNPSIEKIDFEGSLKQSFPATDRKQTLFVMKKAEEEVLYSFQNSSGEKNIILDTAKLAPEKKVKDMVVLDWSKDKRNILLSANFKEEKKFFVLNIDSKNLEDLTALTPIKFDRLIFNTADSDELYGTIDGGLTKVNLRTKNVSNAIENHILYFTFSPNGRIYYIREDNETKTLWRGGPDLAGKTVLSDSIPMSEGYLAKVDPKDQKILFETKENGILYLVTKVGDKNSLITIGKNITDFGWNDEGLRFFYKENGSNIVVFESDDVKKESTEYNVQESNRYKNILWYDSRHILYQNGDKAGIMDFDGTNKITLGKSLENIGLFYTPEHGDIYFFDGITPEKTVVSKYKVEF